MLNTAIRLGRSVLLDSAQRVCVLLETEGSDGDVETGDVSTVAGVRGERRALSVIGLPPGLEGRGRFSGPPAQSVPEAVAAASWPANSRSSLEPVQRDISFRERPRPSQQNDVKGALSPDRLISRLFRRGALFPFFFFFFS